MESVKDVLEPREGQIGRQLLVQWRLHGVSGRRSLEHRLLTFLQWDNCAAVVSPAFLWGAVNQFQQNSSTGHIQVMENFDFIRFYAFHIHILSLFSYLIVCLYIFKLPQNNNKLSQYWGYRQFFFPFKRGMCIAHV